MTRSYRKNTLRTFKNTLSRFAAVFAIVALGVGFLAGLNGTPIDMKESMERYMDDADFYDLRVVSTLGLTDADVAALGQVDGVREVQPGYSADLLVEADGDTIVSRAHSLPAPDNNTINRLRLVDGRLPAASGECVVEAGAMELNPTYPIGTRLVVSSANEALDTKLDTTVYTVLGIVHNANYFSFEREPASVGNGTVKLVFYIPQQDFAFEAYTEIYLTAEGALAQDSLGDDYRDTVDAVKARVEGIAEARCEARYNGIVDEARAELDDAWAEYNDAKAEADRQLADAAAELADGRQQLADGQREVDDGERQYAAGLNELTSNEALLNDGAAQLAEAEAQLRAAPSLSWRTARPSTRPGSGSTMTGWRSWMPPKSSWPRPRPSWTPTLPPTRTASGRWPMQWAWMQSSWMLSSAGWPKTAMQTARSRPRMPRSCGRPCRSTAI